MSGKTYIIYDIETAGLSIDSFDDARQEYLLRGASTDEAKDKKINEMALSPLTGQIVCLGIKVMQKHGEEWVDEEQLELIIMELNAGVTDNNMFAVDDRKEIVWVPLFSSETNFIHLN